MPHTSPVHIAILSHLNQGHIDPNLQHIEVLAVGMAAGLVAQANLEDDLIAVFVNVGWLMFAVTTAVISLFGYW
jgi:hypothetical protein